MDVYEVLNTALMAGVRDGSVTPEQARLASKWLDVQEVSPL